MYTLVFYMVYGQRGRAVIRMKVIPVRLPDKIIEIIDQQVQEGFYANRSAAIRVIVTRYVLKEAEKIERG